MSAKCNLSLFIFLKSFNFHKQLSSHNFRISFSRNVGIFFLEYNFIQSVIFHFLIIFIKDNYKNPHFQFRQYFTDESGLNRRNIQDNRVHCCLYFIPPYGHRFVL